MPSILLLSPFFFPEFISTGKYNTALAEALMRRGGKVTVICSHPIYPQWRPRKAWAELPDITTIRGGIWIRYPKSIFLRRLILELWFAAHVVVFSLRLRNKFDYVVSIFPPNLHFLLAALVLGRRVIRVGIVHDLQGIHAASVTRGVVANVLRSLIGFIERLTFIACDRIIVLSQSMANTIVCGGSVDPARVTVCYPFPTMGHPSSEMKSLARLLPPDRTHVVYSGALGKKQNPVDFLLFFEAAAKRMPQTWFHIFSDGPDFERLRQSAPPRDNLFFHPLVAEADLPELYARSDVQIIPQAAGTESGAMPSKLPNIIRGGCAVFAICAADSEVAELVESHDLGIVASNWDADGLAKRMALFLETELQQWKARCNSSQRREAHKKFDIEAVVDQILLTRQESCSGA